VPKLLVAKLLKVIAAVVILTATGCRREVNEEPEFLIAAASDLRFALDKLVAEFQARSDAKIRVSYGSSGQFEAQIRSGAPFDIFFSADRMYPERLMKEGLGVEGSLFTYAIGHIVLWAPRASGIDVSRGFDVLTEPSIRHIAIANPEHAPYGQAALAALQSTGVYPQVKEKLVYGENVSQTLQYVKLRSADVGIVALSLALSPVASEDGHFWEIPAAWHPPLEQAALIIKTSAQPDLAWKFRRFFMQEDAKNILRAFGFAVPGP
jgi:molybdate transport system substrate-binding protein